jgi:hypothetical protein
MTVMDVALFIFFLFWLLVMVILIMEDESE